MQNKNIQNKNTKDSEASPKNIIIRKKYHRTNRQRILHTLCLLIPVFFAFAGYFISTPLWELFEKKTAAPELFKFICTAVLFLLSTLAVFIATRKANPVMNISLTDAQSPAD